MSFDPKKPGIVWHPPTEPTANERGDEEHPAWGLISVTRSMQTPGAVLFDSDIRHNHTINVRIARASAAACRRRSA